VPLTLTETAKQLGLPTITESGQKVRDTLADVGLDDLLKSIVTNGQIHAVSVIANGDGTYQLINGHRRFAAARKGKLPYLRANVYAVPEVEEDNRELLIQQHLHAANLSEALLPIERARQFERVMVEFDVDIDALPDIFKGETPESIRDAMRLLAIDPRVLDMVTTNPEKFSEGHLRVLADYASASQKGAWRMKPDEQVAAAEMIVKQEDKAAAADPRKFDAHIKSVVAARRSNERQKKADAKTRPQADPVKALFKALEGLESSVKNLRDLDLQGITEIDAADKGAAIKRAYDVVEAVSAFADERVSKLAVRRAAS